MESLLTQRFSALSQAGRSSSSIVDSYTMCHYRVYHAPTYIIPYLRGIVSFPRVSSDCSPDSWATRLLAIFLLGRRVLKRIPRRVFCSSKFRHCKRRIVEVRDELQRAEWKGRLRESRAYKLRVCTSRLAYEYTSV